MLDSAWKLTLFYLRKARTVDKYKTFTVNGYTSNSILWIVGRLAWAEDNLIRKCVGNTGQDIPWFDLFALRKEPPAVEMLPLYEEIPAAFNEVHKKLIELIHSLPDSALDELHHGDLEVFARKNKRTPVMHCSRHASAHMSSGGCQQTRKIILLK